MSDDVTELDDTAARALASIILEHTALMLSGEPDAIVDALNGLAADAAMVPDVAAAILTATSWLVGAGEVAPEAIYAASVGLLPDGDGEPASTEPRPVEAPQAPPGVDGPPEGAAEPQTATEGPIPGNGGDGDPDFAAMAAEAIAAAEAALAAPGGDDET